MRLVTYKTKYYSAIFGAVGAFKKMDWKTLKKKIYFEDGSLRDIYISGMNHSDWKKWADLVNEKYEVEFHDYETNLTNNKIDFKIVEEYWSVVDRACISVAIKIGKINIACYFNDNSEIENDIDPREFKEIEDHNNLITYLRDVSIALDKEVIVTEESTRESKLIRVENENVFHYM